MASHIWETIRINLLKGNFKFSQVLDNPVDCVKNKFECHWVAGPDSNPHAFPFEFEIMTPIEELSRMRREYAAHPLDAESLLKDPFAQFRTWMDQATQADLLEPNAMSLATVTPEGTPSLRTVLLKEFSTKGYVFFTNLESAKACHIAGNPNVSLLFPWLALERQAIICGVAEKLPVAAALKYFVTRPAYSQLAAWVSPQSKIISSRQILEAKLEEMKRKFADGKIPLPSFWGGFRVVPRTFEFWQGGAHRLHDRFLYSRGGNDAWNIERLAP